MVVVNVERCGCHGGCECRKVWLSWWERVNIVVEVVVIGEKLVVDEDGREEGGLQRSSDELVRHENSVMRRKNPCKLVYDCAAFVHGEYEGVMKKKKKENKKKMKMKEDKKEKIKKGTKYKNKEMKKEKE